MFDSLNSIFSFITPVSDWLWDFPTNYSWWSSIPVLGGFSFAVLLLMGAGIYFTVKTGFIQVTHFKKAVKAVTTRSSAKTGISPASSFLLSTAMRVGPGNIIGVTGAISTGGPGALFWMWLSAFFGMATAYVESVLAQIFKEKRGDEYVGGLPFYGRRLLKNSAIVGAFLSVLYILYALCCFPAQGFNTVSSVGQMAGIITGQTIATNSAFYWIVAVLTIALTAYVAFGGIKKVSGLTDILVPIMAVVYCVIVLLLVILNVSRIPYFFGAVFGHAFTSEAVFGGVFGTILSQGIKRGLMSNEAGQGTMTMAAAASDAKHPSEQGCVQALGVFLDTIVICTLTGFVVVMGHVWTTDAADAWFAMDRLPRFLASVSELAPGALSGVSTFIVCLCFCLFAYTCLLGFVSFSEMCARRISDNKGFITFIRLLCLFVAAFGIVCNIAGFNLDNLWAFSDLGNIIIVYFNVPLLFIGAKYAFAATKQYRADENARFTSETIGFKGELFWDNKD